MLKKIQHLFQRFWICCKVFPGNCREFGIKVAALQFWDVLIPIGKSKTYIETLSAFMIRELAPMPSPKKKLDKTPVWVCWWQGEDHMPPVVKACVSKMRRSLPDTAELCVITWDNLKDYIDIPIHIMEKYHQGLITNVHLTDILRYGLMSSYGGAWIDATVLMSDGIKEKMPEFLEKEYFTQRFSDWDRCPQEACRGKWCNFFFMGHSECTLFMFVYESLVYWWQSHNRLIDYVIVDYVIWAGYCSVMRIREIVDKVPLGNENIWLLAKHLNDVYDPDVYESMLAANDFFKLSYKGQLDLVTSDGQKTIYAHILEENGVI